MPPPPAGFKLGLVTGPSGSGKTTMVTRRFGAEKSPQCPAGRPLLACFDCAAPEAVQRLRAVCLPRPAWQRPYDQMSTGERSRAQVSSSRNVRCGAD